METLFDPVAQLAEDLAGITEPAARERIFLKHVEPFGISHFAYADAGNRREPWYVETNYPAEWLQHYLASNFLTVDAVPLEGMRSPAAFHWRAALAKPGYGAEAHRVFHEATAFDIHDGYTVPIHHPGGVALLSMAATDRSLFAPPGLPRLHALQLMSYHYHMAVERSLAQAPTVAPRPLVVLTKRETEVLHWVAKGKTGWEISNILHVAERTVTYHIENAKAKLGAATRGHAVARAISLELITP
jgi:DNA-binding CsgD family transcriptional regulator